MLDKLKSPKQLRLSTSTDNQFAVYTEGDDLYRSMLESIKKATTTIQLECYIFASDKTGWLFAQALAAKAKEGLTVQIIIDAAGSLFILSKKLLRYLKKNGCEVHLFHRWSWRKPFRYNHRNHRKLLVVDNEQAFLGGFNIDNRSSLKAFGPSRWRDTHVKITGSLAQKAKKSFHKVWTRQWPAQLGRFQSRLSINLPNSGESLLVSQHLRHTYSKIWKTAQNSIYLTTPYFVPDRITQKGLMHAAKNGVDVRILVPHKSDVKITQWAARAAYSNLLRAGIKIYEYHPRMLHAKTAVIDGELSSIGTANMDYRSFFLNYEINLISRDLNLCQTLQNQFLNDLTQSDAICAKSWPNRPWLSRITETIGWIARRWL